MNNTEIWVEINGEKRILDLFEDEIISLNYSLADIKDISSRNTSYSKTITLPDSKNNRKAFEYISELTSDSLFNPNLKAPCYIFNRGILVFRGNLQMKSIIQSFTNEPSKYEVVVFNEVDTFFRAIGEKYMSDMDFSYLNHEWNLNNITFSWTQSQAHGYFYPLIDRAVTSQQDIAPPVFAGPLNSQISGGGLYLSEMTPAFYTKTLVDKIFIDSGFSYRSEFIESDYFKKLIMPHNGQTLFQSDEILDNEFIVDYSSTPGYYSIWNPALTINSFQIQYTDEVVDVNNNYQGSPTYSFVQPTEAFIIAFGAKMVVNVLIGSTVSGFQQGALNINTGGKVANVEVEVAFRRQASSLIFGNVPIDGGLGSYNNNVVNFTPIFRSYWKSGGSNSTQNYYPVVDTIRAGGDYEFLMIGNKCYASFSCYVESDDLDNRADADPFKYAIPSVGERIDVLIKMSYNTISLVGLSNLNNVANPNFTMFFNSPSDLLLSSECRFSSIISTGLVPYGIMNMNSVLPRKFKQKDFIKGLINMFNLYIEPDKTNNKILNIEPRDVYYSRGETLDWTDKIDITSIKTSFVSDYQAKKTILTYKKDTDIINTAYEKQFEEIYGQEIVDFDNDFVTKENKIESTFSPTPLISLEGGDNRFPISRIAKDEKGTPFESNPRILFKGYYDLQGNQQNWSIQEVTGANIFTSIPYAGHLDNPFNPTEDLNYGQVYTTSFNWEPTLNTLTNNFWQDYINLINNPNTKIFEANFYLNQSDIANLNLASKIYLNIEGQAGLFIINKIMDYNPVMTTLTKVELIKIN